MPKGNKTQTKGMLPYFFAHNPLTRPECHSCQAAALSPPYSWTMESLDNAGISSGAFQGQEACICCASS